MPNWNSNRLSVKGNVLHVLQFIDENFNNDLNEKKNKYDYVLDFETFLPTPKDENGDIIDSWYEWRNKEWGCKWSPLSEQIIRLIIYKEDGTTEHLTITNTGEGDEFNHKHLEELFNTEDDSDLTAHLEVLFDTPWCPPTGIFVKWIEKYTELDFRLTFYEPGCCFAGEFNNKNKEFNDEYYGTEDEISYIQFILNEGFEELDYYKMILEDILDEINKDEDREFANRLVEKVCQTLDELEDNFSRAMLIVDIMKQLSDIDTEEDK